MPSTAQSGTAQSAITIEAGSGIPVEKTPLFCAVKLVKVPVCSGETLANAREKVPPAVPASAASTAEKLDVKETLLGGCASLSAPEP